jgi:hypothetical protein
VDEEDEEDAAIKAVVGITTTQVVVETGMLALSPMVLKHRQTG